MRVYPNSTPGQIVTEEAGGRRETAPPMWRELCAFGVYLLTVILVFEGMTVFCNLVWPDKDWTAHFASLLLLLGWMFLADWLKIFGERRPVFAGRRYATAFEFLFYFVFFRLL